VKDTGIGLARDKTKLIFERFRQAEESSTKEYGGTGLGLTISKRLVEMLGGELWVESQLNIGSTFFFNLPNRPVTNKQKTKQKEAKTGKHDWSGKIILVAEDEVSNFELIKATLFRTNATIIHALNGLEAVKICSGSTKVDLVLMDIRMPVMNGYEATRLIKAKDNKTPVISLTAYAMSDDREKSFKAGCDEYISKPFNPAELIDLINRYI
jgi:CheY-like chemotaxis protein